MDFAIRVNGEDVKARANVWTLVVYEMEFSRSGKPADLLQDLFGKGRKGEDDGEVVFDFTRTNWTAATKAAWACIKSADDRVEPFMAWSRKVGDMPMFETSAKLADAFTESFFRLGPRVSGREAEERE